MPSPTNSPPFWLDEDDAQPAFTFQTKGLVTFVMVYRMVLSIMIFLGGFALLYAFNALLAWFWLTFIAVIGGMGFYSRRVRHKKHLATLEVQERAKVQSGATVIGSAIHVAGHPQLEREQPIVMALTGSELRFYEYSGVQLGGLPLGAITSIHTVVYDDERVPHLDAVDSTAQALQITFNHIDREFTVLFRRMKPVRPIEWYHALQQARGLGKTTGP